MDRTESIQNQFGPAAAEYAVCEVHAAGADLESLAAAAGPAGEGRVLDVGCGAGHTAIALAGRAREVVALDLTEAMLEQAKALAWARGLENVSFRHGDASALPFEDDSFDLVACRQCAHHFARPDLAVQEVARVLKPGGVFLLVDTVSTDDPAQDTFLNCFEFLRDPSHVRDHNLREWQAMLRDAGLEPEVLETWWIPLDFDDWVRRQATREVSVAALRSLFDNAQDELRETFAVESDYSFRLPAALLRGRA